MRLKSLRKNRPPFEVEGAVVNGNRMALSNDVFKSVHHHRSNTSFVLPTSLNTEISYLHLAPADQIHEMSTQSFQEPDILTASQSSHMSSYKAIQAAYLQHGIRIRLTPRKTVSATRQKPERKSALSTRPQTACVRRHPSRISNVLSDAPINHEQDHDTGSFSTLQQMSSNDFEQAHPQNVSTDELSTPVNEELPDDYYQSSFITSEHFKPGSASDKIHFTNSMTSTNTLFDDNDPDIIYMSSLLKIASVDSFRGASRRQGAVRRTFSTRPYSSTEKFAQSKQKEPREKSPNDRRSPLTRSATMSSVPVLSAKKINNDIRKHASRFQNLEKDYSMKSSGTHTNHMGSSPPRVVATPNMQRQNSNNKTSKSNDLDSLDHFLSSVSRSSLSIDDLPMTKTITRRLNKSTKYQKFVKTPTDENENTTQSELEDHSTSSLLLNKGGSSLMGKFPMNILPRSNLLESSWPDPSDSGADGQSLTSSSVAQMPGSILAGQLTQSATRRSQKRVSFYEEPRPLILTTTTYV